MRSGGCIPVPTCHGAGSEQRVRGYRPAERAGLGDRRDVQDALETISDDPPVADRESAGAVTGAGPGTADAVPGQSR
jgi:hypothetical protein